jgi:hypothetical protein
MVRGEGFVSITERVESGVANTEVAIEAVRSDHRKRGDMVVVDKKETTAAGL